jgi:predicted transcriptional regulator
LEEIKILEELFDRKIIRVLQTLLRDRSREYYLQEISKEANVPMASTSRILTKLEALDILNVRKISRFKLYKAGENTKVEFLCKLFKEDRKVLEKFVELVKNIRGLRRVILHGKKEATRANVLLIGENMDAGDIKGICAEIKDRYGFVISPLSLTYEQYGQMSQMGLYSGTKKVLYDS